MTLNADFKKILCLIMHVVYLCVFVCDALQSYNAIYLASSIGFRTSTFIKCKIITQ